MATKLSDRFTNVRNFTWNHTDSGHGKGSGIGTTCINTADAVVALGVTLKI